MTFKGKIVRGRYFDSVTLMNTARRVREMPEVDDAAMVMGTPENLNILEASGMMLDLFREFGQHDLLIAIKAKDAKTAEKMLETAADFLDEARQQDVSETDYQPGSIEGAASLIPDANLAVISVAGRYAADEAEKALSHGLHVMLFSDNVPLEREIALKQQAQKKDLLLMGPDCGTAIINGVPLGFANAVNRGNIGIVAASGTGLQEVSSIISNQGAGISQAIGAGSRDVKDAVGGITFLQGLHALREDDATKVILLVSKPPDKAVLKKIKLACQQISKPVISLFLGTEKSSEDTLKTLEQAALLAVAAAKGENPDAVWRILSERKKSLKVKAESLAKTLKPAQKYVRGLFSGGTFCSEAQLILQDHIGPIFSNAPAGKSQRLADSLKSVQHSLIDLGEDEFTVGRPHPMIDFSLRKQRILQEAVDPATAIILLDVVLGFGAHPNPAAELAGAIREVTKKTMVICSVTGTEKDPQNRQKIISALQAVGAEVADSNAAACETARLVLAAKNG